MEHNALIDRFEVAGARLFEYNGAAAVRDFGDAAAEYLAAREAAALFPLTWRGALRFVGPDRRAWLHGQVTNEVNRLPEGAWNDSAVINIQGRMIAEMRVFALPDALLADLPAAIAASTAEHLDRYLIMERVEIEDVSSNLRLFSVQGPRAAEVVQSTASIDATSLAPCTFVTVEGPAGAPLIVARPEQSGAGSFDLIATAEAAVPLWDRLSEAVQVVGGRPAGWDALNTLRVESGVPWWGHELDSSIVPLEARLDRAISLTKGCYVGQEIIARIDARGRVNNLLGGLRLSGDTLPEPGSRVVAEEKPIGRVTSAVHSPALGVPIALAFLRREWTEPGQTVWIETEGERSTAQTHALPFA